MRRKREQPDLQQQQVSQPDQSDQWIVDSPNGKIALPLASPATMVDRLQAGGMDDHDERASLQEWMINAFDIAGAPLAIHGLGRIAEVRLRQPSISENSRRSYASIFEAARTAGAADYGEHAVIGMKSGMGILGLVKGE